MLPAVAVRQRVPRDTGIIHAGDETPAGNTARATSPYNTGGRRLAKNRPAAAIYFAPLGRRQHRLDPVRPPNKLRWRDQVLLTLKAAWSCRDPKIRRRPPRP